MFRRIEAEGPDRLLLPMSRRSGGKGVYFVRVTAWDSRIADAVWAYHEAARMRGVIIEGQISNPDERQLAYLNEKLGSGFRPDAASISAALQKWMPRMSAADRAEFSDSLSARLDELRAMGKSDSVLRNIYFKVMCWLYYRFERLIPLLGADDPPRILYECPSITAHELLLLRLLSSVGADILLLEPTGDGAYLKQDPKGESSQLLTPAGGRFPDGFLLKHFRKERMASEAAARTPVARPVVQPSVPRPVRPNGPAAPSAAIPRSRPIPPEERFKKPVTDACTNAWMETAAYDCILTPVISRGNDAGLFYNAYIRVQGVPDRTDYLSGLFRFYTKLQATGRKLLIIDGGLPQPEPEETDRIRRRTYSSEDELITDLAGNLPACSNTELQRLMQQAFVRTMRYQAKQEKNVNRLTTSAVYLLCWIRRYQGRLFEGYRDKDMPCFIMMGGCRGRYDALYPRFLSQLPADVLVLAPDLDRPCLLEDERLLALTGEQSMQVERFPTDSTSLRLNTVASEAERELDSLLYTDGMYRARQFKRAQAVTLNTTLDEVKLLWDTEMKYRHEFAVDGETVTMPVIYARISGVKDSRIQQYWQTIKDLTCKGAYPALSLPLLRQDVGNPFQQVAVQFLRGGVLRREELKADRRYPFGLLRSELQEHILDKLQLMLDRRLIKGTFVNGMEYTVLATVLNLDKSLVRLVQSFDFTRKNPKLICVSTNEQGATPEDAILLTFLHLVGFDIVLFVPTGYETVERYLADVLPIGFEYGDYKYDLVMPDIRAMKGRPWWEDLLNRR